MGEGVLCPKEVLQTSFSQSVLLVTSLVFSEVLKDFNQYKFFKGPCSGIRPIELNDYGARFSAAEIASTAWNYQRGYFSKETGGEWLTFRAFTPFQSDDEVLTPETSALELFMVRWPIYIIISFDWNQIIAV